MDKSDLKKSPSVETDVSDSTDEESLLKIVEDSPKTPERRKSKKNNIPMDFDGGQLDKIISDMSEKCNNFTPEVAKKILMKLVKNEHVLAHAVLKAEEEEAKERRKKHSESEEDGARSEPELPTTPKLTRLKAKQLNTTLSHPGSLSAVQPDEEVIALIREELHSDDEDDEYRPEDDVQSEDEYNNLTYSDIDSQPSTPGSSLFPQDCVSPAKSGDFKVPRPICQLNQEAPENIATRTRSKLCLETTAIETIESTFVPPDITLDMYDFEQDHEGENEWKEFLNEFMMPLLNNPEDDDAEDPEYVALETPLDKEELEMKTPRIPRKEINQLMSELIEESANFMTLDDNFLSLSAKKNAGSSSASKRTSSRISSPVNYFKSPKMSKSSTSTPLHTPPITKESQTSGKVVKVNESMLTHDSAAFLQSTNQFETPKKSQQISTFPTAPAIDQTSSPSIQSPAANSQNFPKITGVYGADTCVSQQQSPMILITNAYNQLEMVPSSSILNQAFDNNGVVQLPQYQSVVTLVPTIDLLQNRWQPPQLMPMQVDEQSQNQSTEVEIVEIDAETTTSHDKNRNVTHADTKHRFDEFNDLESRTPTENVFPTGATGFMTHQWQLFEQQMRIHSQLLTQNFMQTYSHPKFWPHADQFKKNLHKLQELVKPETSPINAHHIKTCIETCETWEKELEEKNEQNLRYAEFMYTEVEFDEEAQSAHKGFIGRFHPRLMEHLLSSKAIVYPWLLPAKPFRCVEFHAKVLSNYELKLWAFEIAKIYPELLAKYNRNNPKKQRIPKMAEIAAELLARLGKIHTEKALKDYLNKLKVDKRMNPIKYVFKHKRYFNFEHNFDELPDLNNIQPPVKLRRGLLPKTWDAYMFSKARVSFALLQLYTIFFLDEKKSVNITLTQNLQKNLIFSVHSELIWL